MATVKANSPRVPRPKTITAQGPAKEVPLQVMVPEKVRRELAHLCAERGENIRTVVLRGLRAVGVQIPESELVDRRGRRKE
jgi:hypothetical protein